MGKNKLDTLHNTIPAHSLALFRIGFGVFMILELLHFYRVGFIQNYILGVDLNFKYDILYVPTPSVSIIYLLFTIAFFSAILIILGKWLKWGAFAFFISFSIICLIEKSIYNNHLYLFCLIALLLTINSNADQAFSLKKNKTNTVFQWNLRSFQLMIIIVYFFGGIAKCNADWLFLYEPAMGFMKSKGINSSIFISIIVYGGLLFDLLIGPLLLIKKTRRIAFIAAIFFNLSNAWIFNDINIFPFVMLLSLVLFLDPTAVEAFFKTTKVLTPKNKVKASSKKIQKTSTPPQEVALPLLESTQQNKLAFYLVSFFFIVQLVFPFRHYFIPGNADWTGDAQRFSWRMKIYTKKVEELKFAIFDMDNKVVYPVDIDTYINKDQQHQMAQDPSMVLQFAKHLAEFAKATKNLNNIEVKVKLKVGMNGRKPIYIVSDEKNLLGIKDGLFDNYKWMAPLN